MRAVLFVPLTLSALSCASSNTALARREQVRAFNAQTVSETQVGEYRSNEGVRGTHWGMTLDEVRALKGEPAQASELALQYREEVDGVPLISTYVFFRGHLAEVRGQLEPQQLSRERLLGALTQKYGRPEREWDKAEAAQQQLDEATRFRVAMAMIDGVTLATPGPRLISPWLLARDGTASIQKTLANLDRPAHEAHWATRETLIDCASFAGDAASITWTSRPLGRLLLKEQMSYAGLAKAAEAL